MMIGDLSVGVYNNRPDITINIDKIELCGKAPEQSSQTSAESFDAANQQTL